MPISGARRGWILGLLTVLYFFNFVDRQIVAILVEPIKADLGLADWQLGVVSGIAFAALYATLGIPIARLADRANRVNIISAAVAVWTQRPSPTAPPISSESTVLALKPDT